MEGKEVKERRRGKRVEKIKKGIKENGNLKKSLRVTLGCGHLFYHFKIFSL
jgi:hypothetical protein